MLVAIFFNSSLIYVTFKFRSTLNCSFVRLIAFESFGAALFELSFLLRFPIPLSGANFIRVDPLCFILQFPLSLGMGIQFVSMVAIGVERLCCVLFPIWFKMHSKTAMNRFIIAVIFIGTFYGLFENCLVFMDIFGELSGKERMCALGDSQGPNFREFNIIWPITWYLQLTTFGLYALIWLKMLKAMVQRRKILSTYNWHILKSISVIMAIIMCGWILQYLGPIYQPYIVLSPEAMFIYSARSIDLMIAAGAMNAPVLYIFSGEYRKCFRNICPFMAGNHVHPSLTILHNGADSRHSSTMIHQQFPAGPMMNL